MTYGATGTGVAGAAVGTGLLASTTGNAWFWVACGLFAVGTGAVVFFGVRRRRREGRWFR